MDLTLQNRHNIIVYRTKKIKKMTLEEILTLLGLVVFAVLSAFSFKMAYEHLFRNYNFEIQNHYKRNNYSITLVRKPNSKERKLNPFQKSSFSLCMFAEGPRNIYKYRIVEFIDNAGINRKQWVEIKIRFLRKPMLKFK